MSILTTSPIGTPAILSTFMAPATSTEDRDLMLEISSLAIGSYITIDSVICI